MRACRGGRGKVGPEAEAGTQAWLSLTANSCHGAFHRVGAVSSGVSRDAPDWMGDPGRSRVHSESVGGWWTKRGGPGSGLGGRQCGCARVWARVQSDLALQVAEVGQADL